MESKLTEFQLKRLNALAAKIIEKNQYLSLATVDTEGAPWISPVCYTYDNDFNFYFVSLPGSRHGKNSIQNNEIAWSIFDSRQKWGQGIGLQITGRIQKLSLYKSGLPGRLYIKRKYPFPCKDPKIVYGFLRNLLINKKIYRFYKLTPQKVWMNNPFSKLDERVEIVFKT